MLKFSIIEFIIIGLPETFLMVSVFYIITRTKFDKKKYSAISFAATVFASTLRQFDLTGSSKKMLATNSSSSNLLVYILIQMIFLILLMLIFNKAKLISLIIATITTATMIAISETLNGLFLLTFLSQSKIDNIISHNKSYDEAFTRAIAFTPSIVFLVIFTSILYYLVKYLDNRKKLK